MGSFLHMFLLIVFIKMEIILFIIWLIATIIYLRASFLAQGKIKTKLFNNETFLIEQKIVAIFYAIGALACFLVKLEYFGYLFVANLIITFLFYLQPTPRTTKKLLHIFILLNFIFALKAILALT